jgi:hypothetical protein
MRNKINQLLSIIAALILGIAAAIIVTKYSIYVAFISIAIIVAVASHVIISNVINKKEE